MRSEEKFGRAWLALTITLGLHVIDEALTDFLSVYNPIVRDMRARFGWFPMPEFTFGVWFGGLCLLVVVLLLLTPLADRGSRALRIFAYPYGVIMFLNGIGHIVGSIYLGRWAPGATTSPLLLATSVWLLREAIRLRTYPRDE